MLNETELKVLSSFFPEGNEITLKMIIERTRLSYEPVYRTVKQLTYKKLVSVKKFGKISVYKIDFKKEEVKLAFFFYAKRKLKDFSEKHGTIFRALSKLNEENVDFLAVFGSYAKGIERKNSDIDVLCVGSNKKDIERKVRGLRYETNLEFAPVVILKSEFVKIKEENEVFWNDLIRFGIIFKGYELFFYYTYLK